MSNTLRTRPRAGQRSGTRRPAAQSGHPHQSRRKEARGQCAKATLAPPFGAWGYGSLCFSTGTLTLGAEESQLWSRVDIRRFMDQPHSCCVPCISDAHCNPGRKVLFLPPFFR